MNQFEQKLAKHGLNLRRAALETLQLNLGRKCNQACRHCHVDAGPWRSEMMDETTARRVGQWIGEHRPLMVDLTGGAPVLPLSSGRLARSRLSRDRPEQPDNH